MLPLKDDIPSRHFPIVTLVLIALNVAAFFYELRLGPDLEPFLFHWGLVPVRYTDHKIAGFFTLQQQLAPLVTSMFLHGGWTHLIGNLWTFWIFGDNVEDRLGRRRYLLLYLTGGIAAGLMHVFTNAHSHLPTIGASGAVAAVMGAYFRLYPRANVSMVIPPFIWGPIFVVPAVVFLGWWFLLQFLNGTLSLLGDAGRVGGVAWWAHIGGFLFGAALCSILEMQAFQRRSDWKDMSPW